MGDVVRTRLERVGEVAFAARGGSGGEVVLDGSPDIGGEGRGMRPMELLLTALAGCAAMDVVHILRRQKEPLESVTIEVEGTRADAVPAIYTAIHLRFSIAGAVHEGKMQRAVRLAVEKYCSVRSSLDAAIAVTWEAVRAEPG
jgi:putative redox protein